MWVIFDRLPFCLSVLVHCGRTIDRFGQFPSIEFPLRLPVIFPGALPAATSFQVPEVRELGPAGPDADPQLVGVQFLVVLGDAEVLPNFGAIVCAADAAFVVHILARNRPVAEVAIVLVGRAHPVTLLRRFEIGQVGIHEAMEKANQDIRRNPQSKVVKDDEGRLRADLGMVPIQPPVHGFVFATRVIALNNEGQISEIAIGNVFDQNKRVFEGLKFPAETGEGTQFDRAGAQSIRGHVYSPKGA